MKNRIFIVLIAVFLLCAKFTFAESRDLSYKLSLQDAISVALDNNPRILEKKQQVSVAKAQVNVKRGEFFPEISLETSYGEWGIDKPKQSSDTYETGISVTQPIYKGGAVKADFKKAQAELLKSRNELEEERQGLIFEVTTSYYDILKAEEIIKINEDTLKQAKKQLAFIKAKFKAGSVLKSDVLVNELNMMNNEQKLIDSRNALQFAYANFNNLLGLDRVTFFELTSKLSFNRIEIDLGILLEEARNNPKLHKTQAEVAIAEMQLNKSKANYFRPELDLVGEYKTLGTTADYSYNEFWSAKLIAKLPIFEGGSNRAEIDKAKFELEKFEAKEKILRREIELGIKENYLELKKLEQTIPLHIKAIKKAEENLQIIQEAYKLGKQNNVELLDSQSLLSEAKTEYINALYEYNLLKTEIDRARGLLGSF